MSHSTGTFTENGAAGKKVHLSGEQYLQHLLAELAAAKNKLDESHASSKTLLNSLGEGLIATNEHGQIITANSYACRCLGYREQDLLGKWMPKTIVAVDQYGHVVDQMSRPTVRALTTGETISENIYYLTSIGDVLPVHVTVSPVMVGQTPTGAIEVFQDLTKDRQLDIAKNEFVSLASHQLRTPATGMKSILSMLVAGDFGPLTALQEKYVAKALQANDRQIQIIEDLLNVALVDSGKLTLDLDFADLSAILSDIVAEHASLLETRNQTIHLISPANIRLLFDVRKTRMVLDNLISNAGKYSPPGSDIHIIATAEAEYIDIAVRDEGVGMSREDVTKLFTKFTRISNEYSSSAGGTGLGLFLAKAIIELHGGTISVASKQDEGSTFRVRLPTKWKTSHA